MRLTENPFKESCSEGMGGTNGADTADLAARHAVEHREHINVPAVKMGPSYLVKDSGKREEFASGMMRDTQEGKVDYWRVLNGPLVERLAIHLTKGATKYPDVSPGTPNWTLAAGEAEYDRFRASAFRHFIQWWRGESDEDHFAAVVFNLNGAESVKERL